MKALRVFLSLFFACAASYFLFAALALVIDIDVAFIAFWLSFIIGTPLFYFELQDYGK